MKPRAVMLEYFVTHSFHCDDDVNEHVFAAVSWHPAKSFCGKPVELWWKDLFRQTFLFHCFCSIATAQSINCEIEYELQTVYAVVPSSYSQHTCYLYSIMYKCSIGIC